MHIIKLAFGTIAVAAFASTASAQTVGIGSTKAGAVAQITATISKVVSSHADGVQMRSQTMGGTQQYIPVVNAGELAFGISNIPQYRMALSGTGLSEGTKYDNLRLISTMMKFRLSLLVPKELGATKISDMKGKRLPSGFKASPLFASFVEASLATGGLSYNDVENVPIVGLVQSWRAMMEGKVDGVITAVGTGFIKQMNATISGGVRYISLPNTPEAEAAVQKVLPGTYFSTMEPAKTLTGIVEPTTLITYDFILWTHKGMDDETVYKVTKVMHQHADELKEGGPLWSTYEADKIAKDQDVEFHPGALKYYKEAGLLPNS